MFRVGTRYTWWYYIDDTLYSVIIDLLNGYDGKQVSHINNDYIKRACVRTWNIFYVNNDYVYFRRIWLVYVTNKNLQWSGF